MTAATTLRIAIALTAVLAAAACNRREPATIQVPGEEAAAEAAEGARDTAEEAASEQVPGTDALSAVPTTDAEAGTQPVPETIAGADPKAFAGTFSAEGVKLELSADGGYVMTVHAESAGADLRTDGTWTVEDGGARLLLDPNSKSEQDRTYAVVSADELKAEDGGQVLTREGSR